jgi:hypothetical protein
MRKQQIFLSAEERHLPSHVSSGRQKSSLERRRAVAAQPLPLSASESFDEEPQAYLFS